MTATREYLSIIRELCTPNAHYTSVFDIPLDSLFTQDGYRHLVLDINNTLISNDQKRLSLRYLNWIDKAKSIGFDVYLLSNNRSYDKTYKIIKQTETKGLHFACKPLTYSLHELTRIYGINLKQTVLVGDQLLTDVVMGKWSRTHVILVDPIDKRMSFIKTVQRDIELKLIDWLEQNSGKSRRY